MREVVATVEESFGYSENRLLSFNDVYAGKMCAALDRQHPRDLFDIALLLDREGIGRELIKTFLVYLIGHNRPIAELLAPRHRNIARLYDGEFREMTRESVPLQTLLDARERLVATIHAVLTDEDRAFLLSIKGRRPDWSLIDLPGVADLPAVRWKLVKSRSNERTKARGCARQAQAGPWQVASRFREERAEEGRLILEAPPSPRDRSPVPERGPSGWRARTAASPGVAECNMLAARECDHTWKISAEEIREHGYDLDIRNPRTAGKNLAHPGGTARRADKSRGRNGVGA